MKYGVITDCFKEGVDRGIELAGQLGFDGVQIYATNGIFSADGLNKSAREKYKKLLKDGGLLIFKTDNVGLFDFSLEEFAEFGLKIEWMTRDLHNSERAEGNVMTEYEKNFSEKGFTINSAIVRF